MFRENKNSIPTDGYIFEQWGTSGYRATAVAYSQRTGLNSVEHTNGTWYTLAQFQEVLIDPKSITNLNEK